MGKTVPSDCSAVVLVLFARLFFRSPTLCIPLGIAAYMLFTSGFCQLNLFFPLGNALFLLFANSAVAMMAGQTFCVGLQSFFLLGNWHAAGVALVVGAAL